MKPHFYAIVNQHAGNYRGRQIWHKIQDHLIGSDIRLSVLISTYAGAPRDFAYDLAANLPDKPSNIVILAFGGDGTLHEVLNGLLDADRKYPLPLAYLPAGSGNDFARGAKMRPAGRWQAGLEDLLQVNKSSQVNIAAYQLHGETNKHYFMNSFGIGFDGTAVQEANRSKHKKFFNHLGLGAITYLVAALISVFKTRSFPAQIQTDHFNKKFSNAFLLTVTNQPYFGGGLKIAPDASITEPNLKLVLFRRKNLFQVFANLLTVILGNCHYKLKSVYHTTMTNDFDLIVNSRQTAQVDGQSMILDCFHVKISHISYPFWLPESK
ncbi:YegS/Rv2252/BmrU family lipid kinase [Oenococcus sicerae]|uniref:YegS/Rv2252/BmrU family lipid kinase n=1 Tax=Oenococcus sicerae TaxID=2203724 RepID=A0AAJ1R7H2_9LACO|nr:YegS/Rv2252/BmrU family lipid kinase [Oenococcus sicerae]MDN6899433.1 YegS/Rv2252/BmrU family lipid kinase [Oenococcus sicerae]QAS70133.1 YegS/Rv2252/BmrU family lipid kinase [Oenococcus sicerae]VDK13703.1 Putative lipid kinase YtlR [Oenococcus sicerae]